ncbi:hypothetical protein T492DRAFT_1126176 [Pavlovales sp. CCMP2436]|nr:hypothetical protein T492DRAFT_1126176 [Pavlovales sp. CCMP2436]
MDAYTTANTDTADAEARTTTVARRAKRTAVSALALSAVVAVTIAIVIGSTGVVPAVRACVDTCHSDELACVDNLACACGYDTNEDPVKLGLEDSSCSTLKSAMVKSYKASMWRGFSIEDENDDRTSRRLWDREDSPDSRHGMNDYHNEDEDEDDTRHGRHRRFDGARVSVSRFDKCTADHRACLEVVLKTCVYPCMLSTLAGLCALFSGALFYGLCALVVLGWVRRSLLVAHAQRIISTVCTRVGYAPAATKQHAAEGKAVAEYYDHAVAPVAKAVPPQPSQRRASNAPASGCGRLPRPSIRKAAC